MKQHLGAVQLRMDNIKCGIDDLRRNVIHVGHIHEIEDEAAVTAGDQIFRVVFRSSATSVAERLPVIRLLAGMNEEPSRLATGMPFVRLIANKKA